MSTSTSSVQTNNPSNPTEQLGSVSAAASSSSSSSLPVVNQLETIKKLSNEDEKETTTLDEEHIYVVPERCVKTPVDMALWEKSEAYFDIVGFINSISQSIQGRKNTDNMDISQIAQNIIKIFDELDQLLTETPAIDQPQRFGNRAYKDWSVKLQTNIQNYLRTALPDKYQKAIPELVVYFTESFGNSTRIDYGTGHELSFIMFLCCLFKCKILVESDRIVTGVKIFNRYLLFVRKLQMTYRMEPAGSHGVWSLDDYQFVPFIWGSAQLAVNSPIRPSQFLEENIINEYKDKFMFVGCIDYINKVKTGHFAEHSPQLWNISAVESWTKINTGLVKMFQKELLCKFPVIQHVLFGSLMVFKSVKPGTQLPTARLGMVPPSTKSFKIPTPKPNIA